MNRARQSVAVALLSIGMLVTTAAWVSARSPAGQHTAAPDNTKTNQRDRSVNAVTAEQQKENRTDRELAKQITRAIAKDKSLSTYAHNVKIVVQNGAVTLKGPVRTEEEKKAIETKATEVAGEGKVTCELEIKPEG